MARNPNYQFYFGSKRLTQSNFFSKPGKKNEGGSTYCPSKEIQTNKRTIILLRLDPFKANNIIMRINRFLGDDGMPFGEVEIGCAFFKAAILDAAVTVNSAFFEKLTGRLLALFGA